MLEVVVPANLEGGSGIFNVNSRSLWAGEAAIRFVSFILGGYVSVLLARGLPIRLLVLLLVVAALGTAFAQFPNHGSVAWLAVWSVSGPAGIILGAWVANAKRGVA